MTSRTVIFVNRFFYPDHSATSQILSDLAFHLAKETHDVAVVTGRWRYDGPGEALPNDEHIDGVKVHRVWSTHFSRATLAGRLFDYLTFYLFASLRVLTLARSGCVVVVMTDPPMLSILLAPIVRMRRAYLVNWLQDLFPEVGTALGVTLLQGWKGRFLKVLRDRSLAASSRCVVLGEIMAARVQATGMAHDKIAIIANWTDDATIQPLARNDNPLRRTWELGDRFVVGYFGNLGRAHQFDTLLSAAQELRDRDDFIFLFGGGGHHHSALRAQVDASGDKRFRFLPYQDRALLATALGAADVHWTSLRPELEGLIVPSKFYGIAAAGRPIVHIGDREGELGRLVARYDCGVTVAEDDGAGLARVLASLADHPERCQAMGQRARAMIDADFSQKASLRQWSELIGRIGA